MSGRNSILNQRMCQVGTTPKVFLIRMTSHVEKKRKEKRKEPKFLTYFQELGFCNRIGTEIAHKEKNSLVYDCTFFLRHDAIAIMITSDDISQPA